MAPTKSAKKSSTKNKSKLDSVPQESQKVELEVKQLDSDLESSTEADGAQDAILENIVPSKAKKLPKQRVIPMDQREKDIESMLFGSLSSFADFTAEQDEDSQDDEETLSPDHISPYSTDDEEPEQHVLGMKAARDAEKDKAAKGPANKKKKVSETEVSAAWTDDDDDEEHVNIVRSERSRKLRREVGEQYVSGDVYQKRLREQHAKLSTNNTPSWAQLPETSEADESAFDVLKSTSKLLGDKNVIAIEPDKIRIGLMADANKSGVSKAVVQSVKWHPNGSILMTAGFDKTLRLFDIDGLKNSRLQSAHFGDLPISSAQFSPSGSEIYLCGLHHSFYVYDILSAKIDGIDRLMGAKEENYKAILCSPAGSVVVLLGGKGQIHVVSTKTKQWIKTLKMNSVIYSAIFSPDGSELWTAGKRGEIYVWDMETYTCKRRLQDEGNGSVLAMAISPSGEYLATGQDSGIVNIYRLQGDDNNDFYTSSKPKPVKTIMNLTTCITSLEFNHDSQLLAIASNELRNKLRLVHVPSFRVYQNWPTEQTPLGRVSCLSFSPEGNWLAVGNVRGAVKLFKLHHYHPSSNK